jgi:fatty-acyl-CoA synthase
MVRDREGEINVMLNRCTHRGAQVCESHRGNSHIFRCPYHGWSFNSQGKLLGLTYSAGYPQDFDKASYNLKSAKVDTYRGFVFANLSDDACPLLEHLGNAAEGIDRFVDFSPSGKLNLSAGFAKHKIDANWKIVLENETDGHHPLFSHRSIFSVVESNLATVFDESSEGLVRDLGGGHTELDFRPVYRRIGQPFAWLGSKSGHFEDYQSALKAAKGSETAADMLLTGPPHIMIFPNLFLAELSVHFLQPVSATCTIQHCTIAQFEGAPTLNRRMIRKAEGTIGPAGLLQADDAEMYESVQRGIMARAEDWVSLKRGLHREVSRDNGVIESHFTDESSQRGIWRHYRSLMGSTSPNSLNKESNEQ